jgi:hypothetical protein
MKRFFLLMGLLPLAVLALGACSASHAQEAVPDEQPITQAVPTLAKAVMCEDIQEFKPKNASVVFSISRGKVFCYTFFDPVPEQTFIYHQWIHRNKLNTKRRLYLQTPRWSSFSSIQLRESDKGPWRVEILDQSEKVLTVLTFSITD